jgi:transcriptional regulator with XRE-family HTH domain
MDEEHIRTIGERVRINRRFRGMSQQQLADLSGLSQGFISLIEKGDRELERRRDIIAIADALRVSVTDLTGQPLGSSEQQTAASAAVPDVRRALLGTSLDYTEHAPRRPLGQLAQDTFEATRIRVEDRGWEPLGRLLPDLLLDVHAAALGDDERETAQEALVLALANTAVWLKDLGYVDLAWIAADRSRQAALLRDDPLWVAYGHWMVANILLSQGAPAPAGMLAARAAEDAPRGREQGLEVYGMLRLMSALTATAAGEGDPDAALADAQDAASHTGEGDAFRLMFGPTNVRLWTMAITLEAGDPDAAVQVGRGVEAGKIRLTERRAAYHKDMGLALARLRLDAKAVQQLRTAEDLDETRMRNHPIVRDAVAGMLTRARREAGGRELRGMAHRMGIIT